MSKIEVNAIEPQCGTTLTVGAVGTTVAVPSNVVKSNALQASDAGNIISQSGTTITLGATGDSINLAGGATQSGFGRTGTVDWQTTIQTSTPFTAASGVGYFVNTTASAITMNLPASPSVGDIVSIKDYAFNFGTNKLTVGRNGSNLDGTATDQVFNTSGLSLTLIYMDATKGWSLINEDTTTVMGATFVTASGGTITCSGDYKIHTFTGPGTFCVSAVGNPAGSSTVDYLVVAGGAGGGGFGGGGAGGYRESPGVASGSYSVSPLGVSPAVALPVSVQGYTIAVGAGGGGGSQGVSGVNSTFSSITSAGGGGGGGFIAAPSSLGVSGGSGGGGGSPNSAPYPGQVGGNGNTPPVSPPQGNDGGNGKTGAAAGGGGGGATVAGATGPAPDVGGVGGAGATSSINATAITRAGGGGAGAGTGSPGGAGGGGNGTPSSLPSCATAGTVNTGGGGGGNYTGVGAGGGSGIVIIRYKFQ
jgi:hypothetical protein